MDLMMSRFTKEQMFNELGAILLYQADHVATCAGNEAAEEFIDLPFESTRGYYWELDPLKVNLGRFQIRSFFDRAYDFAFNPSPTHAIDRDQVGDLIIFMDGIPRTRSETALHPFPVLPAHRFMTPDGYCQIVADAAAARWKLEKQRQDEFTAELVPEFTTRELALLANMSEGAVRNAMADKGENGLQVIPGSKPVRVSHEEAIRWLSGRRGFIPTPLQLRGDAVVKEKLAAVRTADDLGRVINAQLMALAGLRLSPLKIELSEDCGSAALEWEDLSPWLNGTFRFDTGKAQDLATALEFDVPLFVGKALEVSLRRDIDPNGGGRS